MPKRAADLVASCPGSGNEATDLTQAKLLISVVAVSGKDASVINTHDMGREVQLSFYSGPSQYEPSPGSQQCNTSWRQGNWPWNPIGAGEGA